MKETIHKLSPTEEVHSPSPATWAPSRQQLQDENKTLWTSLIVVTLALILAEVGLALAVIHILSK